MRATSPSAPLAFFWAPELPETETPQTAVDRDVVVSAPPPPKYELLPHLPSEASLRGVRRSDAVFVPGLGPLPSDDPGLRSQVTRAVRGQGIEAARRHVRDLREGAAAMRAGAEALGAGPALERAAALHGLADRADAVLDALEAERARVQDVLQPYVLREADRMLAASRARIPGLRAQYFLPSGAPRDAALTELRAGAKQLWGAHAEVRRAEATLEPRERAVRVKAARARLDVVYAEVREAHPLLTSFGPGASNLGVLRDLSIDQVHDRPGPRPRPLADPLRGLLDGMEGAIEGMQARLREEPDVIWRLPDLVQATLIREGVDPRSMLAAHARDLTRKAGQDGGAWATATSLVAMGLGVAASVPTGGASLVISASAAAVADGYQLFLAIDAFSLQADAAGTDLEPRRALAHDAPPAGGLLLDVAAAVTSAVGAGLGWRALRARPDPLGDMARALEGELGAGRAERVGLALGDEHTLLEVFVRTDPALWAQLADVDPATLEAATRALGPERWVEWSEALGPEAFADLVRRMPAESWPHLLATEIGPKEARAVLVTLPQDVLRSLAPTLKGQGLVDLAGQPGAHTLTLAEPSPYVRLDGALAYDARTLARGDAARTIAARDDWAAMKRELGPIGERVKHVDGQDIRWIRKLADDRRSGTKPTGRQLTDLSERLGIERGEVRRVIDDLAGLPPPVLSARARRIVAEAPELRSGLEALAASDAPVDLQQRTLRSVERAVTEERAVIDREHLRGWLDEVVISKGSITSVLSDRMHELDWALRAVHEGRVMEGTTVFLGVKPGTRVQLRPGGPVIELKDVAGKTNGLYDLDVVYLRPDGKTVEVAEVKRTANALWMAIKQSDRHEYLKKFTDFRNSNRESGQPLELTMVFGERGEEALDIPITKDGETARDLLGDDWEIVWPPEEPIE
ncbi:MAG: hypothetical protein KC933_01515 [Myxococcales bacterium]|nr:hypothetical protein [Myxococcales bacterium]